MSGRRGLWLVTPFLVACAGGPLVRDAPPVWRVDDSRDIPLPSEREYFPKPYFTRVFVADRIDRALSLPDREPAWNTNSLDEVPDSTWFQNRIGVRSVSPSEAARGASAGGPPRLPLRIAQGKHGGGNPGFVATDASGRKFLVKFDTLKNPELQTAAGVVVNRIFWALGFNVPSDHVFVFRREDLSIAPEARFRDALGRKHPLGVSEVEAILRTSPRRADGAYRAFASEILSGTPVGGFSAEGTREDDPNDRVPHEHRRELRGLRVFAAWVGHTDMKDDNTLDVFVEEQGRHFLRHYLLDFGEAMDGHAAEKDRLEDGFEYFIDWGESAKALLALGLWKRPWEARRATRWASVGAFSASAFDPVEWREAYPYRPFLEADAADAYWAAKLVMRFERPVLRAIVAEARYSDPEAAAYVVDTLYERRTQIGRAFLEAVSPLDDFEASARGLCMTDLGVRYGLAREAWVERLDGARVVETRKVHASGRVCLRLPFSDRYGVLRLRVRRGQELRPPLEVHLKGGLHARVLGILRAP